MKFFQSMLHPNCIFHVSLFCNILFCIICEWKATFVTKNGGSVEIAVDVLLGGEIVTSASNSYQAYGEGASLVPLIIILILGFSTRIIELSLGAGVFIGACMISGNVQDGFTSTLENYILGAVAVSFYF